MELSFIIIDDSELDGFIARKIIGHVDKNISVTNFQTAGSAFEAINQNIANDKPGTTIILLDLQMPLMNGFQFVEAFEKLPEETRKKFLVVILSSTRNNNDIFRIMTHRIVHSIIEKPLTAQKLHSLLLDLKSPGK